MTQVKIVAAIGPMSKVRAAAYGTQGRDSDFAIRPTLFTLTVKQSLYDYENTYFIHDVEIAHG